MSKTSYIHLLILFGLGIAIYAGATGGPFVFDDTLYILDNPPIRDLSNFIDISGTRYLGLLSFALNYAAFGYDPLAFKLTNLTIHLLNAALIYSLVLLLFRTSLFAENQELSTRTRHGAAFVVALLFIAHPVETQAVNYITQRFTSLAAFFYLLSIVLYLKARLTRSTGREWFFYVLSLISCLLAQKTKEIAFTLPILILFIEFAFIRAEGSFKGSAVRVIPFLLSLLIIPLTLLAESGAGVAGSGAGAGISGAALVVKKAQMDELLTLSSSEYLFTQFRVIVTYLRLLVWPSGQNLLYDYPHYKSLAAAGPLLSLVFLLSIAASALYLFIRSRVSRELYGPYGQLVAFGVFWFFVTLGVESSVIPIKHVIFEHRLYLPSVGPFIAVGAAFSALVVYLGNEKRVRLAWVVFFSVLIVLALSSYKRNEIWSSELALWSDTARKSPALAEAHNNLGLAYEAEANINAAIDHYKEALSLKTNYSSAYVNLGRAYYIGGDRRAAMENYMAALSFNPEKAEAHNNLANIYMQSGELQKASIHLAEAVRLKPGSLEITYNLASLSFELKHYGRAISGFEEALRIDPDHVEASFALAQVLAVSGETARAIAQYKKLLISFPGHAPAHSKLALIYNENGDVEGAISHFAEAARIAPENHDYSFNLAWLYHSTGRVEEAISAYLSAIAADPMIAETHYNLALVYIEAGDRSAAASELNKALVILPGYPDAKNLLQSLEIR